MPGGSKYEILVMVPVRVILFSSHIHGAGSRAKELTAKLTREKGGTCTLVSVHKIRED